MRATKKQGRYHENATLAMGQSGSRRGSVGTQPLEGLGLGLGYRVAPI